MKKTEEEVAEVQEAGVVEGKRGNKHKSTRK